MFALLLFIMTSLESGKGESFRLPFYELESTEPILTKFGMSRNRTRIRSHAHHPKKF